MIFPKNKIQYYIARRGEENFLSHGLTETFSRLFFQRLGLAFPGIRREANGKPFFCGGDYHLSVTHTDSFYLLAIAPFPIGVDAECEERKKERVAERFFDEEEKKMPFSLVWTAKEAVSKLTGEGLGAVGRIRVRGDRAYLDGNQYALSTEIREGIRITVAITQDEAEHG